MHSFISVSERISEFARTAPNSIALSFGEKSLTFAQLDTQANCLAGYLRGLGVSEGCTVSLCLERSIDWVVAALGVMKVGAAYVPLDIAWPDARIRYAIEDSDSIAVIARTALLDRLQLPEHLHGVASDRDAALIDAADPLTTVRILSESLAYVIYTSGSTGVPKGVEITHSNLENLIKWHIDTFEVTPRDRASQFAGLGFDAAVWEMWGNLTAGANLCLADDAIRSSPELMQQWIVRERITISFVPTVHASAMIAMVWPDLMALRYLLTGGEALLHAPPRPLPFTVVNNYGPTECTVVTTSSIVTPGSSGPPAIGRPIGGAVIHLLDENQQAVPDGQIGEIYISGRGLGRGYRNLPDATRQSFLPHPFPDGRDARMYRTGDRGIRRPNGDIEFAGRLDRQTKIRGQRIELDEIGSVLETHPAVRFATAVVRRNTRGEDQIVAYVLPKEGLTTTVKDLQDHLLQDLPEYMVPAVFVRLVELPLSVNGKIDLTVLPAPNNENILERRLAKRPSSAVENQVLEIIRDLLGQPSISMEDNFFLAGGHSLLGMQLVMRLRAGMGTDFTLRELFESPTSERLAESVNRKRAEHQLIEIWGKLLGLAPASIDDNFLALGGNSTVLKLLREEIEATFSKALTVDELLLNPTIKKQARLVCDRLTDQQELPDGVLALRANATRSPIFWAHYLNTNLARAMDDDQAFIHVSLTSQDVDALGEAPSLQEVAARLAPKIIATDSKGPYILGGYCLGGILAYEMASQLQASGHPVSLLVLLDTPSPSYFESPHALTPRITNPGYLLKRVSRLGLRSSLERVRRRVESYIPDARPKEPVRAELDKVQSLIELAAASYTPGRYTGKVSLILAEDHPPHIDFLSGWRELVPNTLHAQYLLAHHDELMSGEAVQNVANAMASQIKSIVQEARSLQQDDALNATPCSA